MSPARPPSPVGSPMCCATAHSGAMQSCSATPTARMRRGLHALAELAESLAPAAERRLETLAQGAAFRAAAKPWPCTALAGFEDTPLAYPIAVGALAAAQGVGEDDAALALLHAGAANMIFAAQRLIPLGQDAGLRVQAALESVILLVAADTKAAKLEDLGGAAWRTEIAAMRHETQYTRLFRT